MSKSLGKAPSELYGLTGIEAYALNSAVVLWGTAFDAAVTRATSSAKTSEAAEAAAQKVLRRWIPSQRRYR
jgi:hypothetical protein